MTMAATAIAIVAVVGAGISAYGQYQQGKSAQAQAKAQSKWNLYNAKVAQREKAAQEKANRFASAQQKKKSKAHMSRLKSLIGAAGVETEGSPLLAMEDTAAELAKEEQNLRISGQRKTARLESQSILDVSKASAAKSAAAGYGRQAVVGAVGTSLSGAASAGYQYKQMKA